MSQTNSGLVDKTSVLELVAKVCCSVAKNNGTIFEACQILYGSGADIKPLDLAPHIRLLCERFPKADQLIGHWPKYSGGAVFLGDRHKTVGEFGAKLKRGQHISFQQIGRPGFVEISKYIHKDDEISRPEWLGSCQRRSIRLVSDW